MMPVTVESVLALGPCERWTEERLRSVLGEGIPLHEAVLLPSVSRDDRLWVATRWAAHHDPRLLSCWLVTVVERAIRLHVLDCGVLETEAWGRAWLAGDPHARTEVAAEAAARAAAAAAWAARVAETALAAAWAARAAAWAARVAETAEAASAAARAAEAAEAASAAARVARAAEAAARAAWAAWAARVAETAETAAAEEREWQLAAFGELARGGDGE